MKQIKNLAVLASRMLTAVVMVMCCMVIVSCNKDMDVDEGLIVKRSLSTTNNSPLYGEKIINDSTKRDSVVTPDGIVDKIDLKFRIKAREDRKVFVDDFSNPNADEYFSSDRRLLDSRQEGNWMVYTYVTNPHKGVQVSSTGETVSYETLEEIATYIPTSYEFKSQGWEVENTSDVFKAAPISSEEGFTELDYTNGIKATYTGVSSSKVINLTEKIAWFAKGSVPVPEKYEATGDRKDTQTYTTVTYEKFAIYTDGHRESFAKDSENLPIRIVPEANWTINVDNLGTYVSNAFAKTLISKTPRKQGNFSYNEYCYRVYNTVAGQTNSFLIYVPNDIVREDKEAKKEYANTDLVVAKGNEATTFKSEDDSKKVYAYNVVANVVFGASQNVTLPGTINVKKVATVDHYDTTGDRNDTQTYTTVTYEKFAIYNVGSRESVAKDSENLPIRIVPETNWTINVDNLGTYVSNAFNKTLISKTPRKQGNFSYNEYCYRVYNTVAGQTNSFLVYVPNDIVREDKDARMEYKNTDLVVAKGSEATTFKTEDDSKKVYAYSVVANVIFGASQNVTLPGTINVKKETPANHDHGKVKDVIFTTTQDENKSYYKSVCVIVFEDGYRSIGMTDNGSKVFSFTMSSTISGVNSAVYADGMWVPSKANDDSTCMIWRNESGAKKRVLDYISATAQKWNNGHNTISDPRRSYTIIDGGYGVTLSLNGASGQTLHF